MAIVEAALEAGKKSKPLTRQTLDLYASVLGVETGNLALNMRSTGGLYLGDGMPPWILSHLGDGRFMRDFAAKGRFAELPPKIPIKVVTAEAALPGAAPHGFRFDTLQHTADTRRQNGGPISRVLSHER